MATRASNQLLDAAWSISTNIAEGCGASTQAELARFLDVGMKSAKELEHHLSIARDLGAITLQDFERLNARLALLRRQLFALITKVRRTPDRDR